jgi:CTP-dependent riboflavin kinase
MAKIAGVTLKKNSRGAVTHVTFSRKHHSKLVEDMEDGLAIQKARSGNTINWNEARKRLNKKFGFKD